MNSCLNLNSNLCVEYIRYADDFIIIVKGERDKAKGIKKTSYSTVDRRFRSESQ